MADYRFVSTWKLRAPVDDQPLRALSAMLPHALQVASEGQRADVHGAVADGREQLDHRLLRLVQPCTGTLTTRPRSAPRRPTRPAGRRVAHLGVWPGKARRAARQPR